MSRSKSAFQTIRSEGGLLPADLLQRIAGRDKELGGLRGEDYHLAGLPLNEAIVRSWNRLVGAWAHFREARAALAPDDPGTTVTRERWLLALFDELSYGRLQTARAVEVDGRPYPVSHAWGHVPVHLVGAGVPLDRRTAGVAGAATHSPHGLLQELLNRSEERLWGFVSNGLLLRLLRDNSALTRQAYLEFDLEQMLESEAYADFVLLWLACHQSRLEGERPHECWLEGWSQEARRQGTRALDSMRDGVERAISALGSGFLSHPGNAALRDALRSGELATQDYYRELLRLVYRLLFLFVAEDRELLLSPDASAEARERYERWYSTRRLRSLAERRRGTKHADLYEALRLVMARLGDDGGCPELGLPALGSFLWSREAMPHLAGAQLANADLLDAVRALATVRDGKMLRAVDYRNLGAEELGSVYESLLELHPELNADAGTFGLTTAAGNERKTTGSYYTPSSLISVLLDSALDPVLEEAAAKGEQGILDLKVCDPACGSGHFLVAAAHRIAKRLAALRTGDEEPSPEATRHALRDVVSRCLYGVDLNPMAVELCKVSLWMEALDPGRPLGFLDAHIRCGNSLLGTTPEVLAAGIPDDAFKPIEGDDKKVASELRKRNKREREGQLTLDDEVLELDTALAGRAAALDAANDDTIAALHEKEERFRAFERSGEHERAKLLANAWCAAFVQPKVEGAPHVTQGALRRLARDPASVPDELRSEIARLAAEYRLFHWHVEFPAAFAGPTGGFDCVLGNPPWERVKLQEKEFFAGSHPEIASGRTKAQRQRLIEKLRDDDPALYDAFRAALRRADGESQLLRGSGRYPLAGRGDVNTYAVFAELMRSITRRACRTGCVVPSGLATDDNTKQLFQALMRSGELTSFHSFDNREGIFPAVKRSTRFGVLTLARSETESRTQLPDFVFYARSTADLADAERHFSLSLDDIALLNPNTHTCPVFSSGRDAELNKAIYRRVPVLWQEAPVGINSWGLTIRRVFDMNKTEVLDLCVLPDEAAHEDELVPMYEAKLIDQFDHRAATYVSTKVHEVSTLQKQDETYRIQSRYMIHKRSLDQAIGLLTSDDWLVAWQDVTDVNTMSRSVIAAVLPRVATDFTLRVGFLAQDGGRAAAALLANLNSFCFDYLARQKIGGTHLSDYVLKQLPIVPRESYSALAEWDAVATLEDWVAARVLELTYTSTHLGGFAANLGHTGRPFVWSDERRFLIRSELDSAFFRLYGLERADVDYVMDTFPIVRRRDEEAYGEYRTKRLILEIYDELAEAIATGRPYQTRLDPPPADPRVAHAPRAEHQSSSSSVVVTMEPRLNS